MRGEVSLTESSTDYDDIADWYIGVADTLPGNRLYERPATMALLPPLEKLDVLDAGCGAGFWTEHCHAAGARVVAFDPSARMAAHTAARVAGAEVHHCKTPALAALVDDRRFDLVLSCLVLHYVIDLPAEIRLLAERLKPDGRLIVSMKHPFVDPVGIARNGYWRLVAVEMDWGVKVVHVRRTLSAISRAIAKAGLVIERLEEPRPPPGLEAADPKTFKHAAQFPMFIQFVLRR